MANQHTVAKERAALQQISMGQWERERTQRVDALCAAITAQRTALSKMGNAHAGPSHDSREITAAMGAVMRDLRVALAATMAEHNPFTG